MKRSEKWDDLLIGLKAIAAYMGCSNHQILRARIQTDGLPILRANGGKGQWETTKRALHMWSLKRFGVLDMMRNSGILVTKTNDDNLREFEKSIETVNTSMHLK